jgi:hypothetical protein
VKCTGYGDRGCCVCVRPSAVNTVVGLQWREGAETEVEGFDEQPRHGWESCVLRYVCVYRVSISWPWAYPVHS